MDRCKNGSVVSWIVRLLEWFRSRKMWIIAQYLNIEAHDLSYHDWVLKLNLNPAWLIPASVTRNAKFKY